MDIANNITTQDRTLHFKLEKNKEKKKLTKKTYASIMLFYLSICFLLTNL